MIKPRLVARYEHKWQKQSRGLLGGFLIRTLDGSVSMTRTTTTTTVAAKVVSMA